jgi:uncharacterized protein YeaO (DUF488 family)
MQATITLKRIYDHTQPAAENSFLVDRLWPRGISKERLQGVVWLKSVAPSNELRQWFHKNLEEWPQFTQSYWQELDAGKEWQPLVDLLQQNQNITLLYGSKNLQQNHAIILRDFLLGKSNQTD